MFSFWDDKKDERYKRPPRPVQPVEKRAHLSVRESGREIGKTTVVKRRHEKSGFWTEKKDDGKSTLRMKRENFPDSEEPESFDAREFSENLERMAGTVDQLVDELEEQGKTDKSIIIRLNNLEQEFSKHKEYTQHVLTLITNALKIQSENNESDTEGAIQENLSGEIDVPEPKAQEPETQETEAQEPDAPEEFQDLSLVEKVRELTPTDAIPDDTNPEDVISDVNPDVNPDVISDVISDVNTPTDDVNTPTDDVIPGVIPPTEENTFKLDTLILNTPKEKIYPFGKILKEDTIVPIGKELAFGFTNREKDCFAYGEFYQDKNDYPYIQIKEFTKEHGAKLNVRSIRFPIELNYIINETEEKVTEEKVSAEMEIYEETVSISPPKLLNNVLPPLPTSRNDDEDEILELPPIRISNNDSIHITRIL